MSTGRSRGEDRSASPEARLLDYVERLSRYRDGRRAVHIHLSRLQAQNRREHHLRIAASSFEVIVSHFEGQVFQLSNADIVFICRGASPLAIDEAIMRVRYLFTDDPLVAVAPDHDSDPLCTYYDIERDFERLLELARRVSDEETRRQRRLAQIATGGGTGAEAARPPVEPRHLGELVDALARADLSNVMRRQSVCMIMPNQPVQTIFRELFISIADLRDVLMPTHDIAADRALFQYLTLTLDRRMLALLRKNDDRDISNSFSLNLNVASLLSPDFLAFDNALRGAARGTIVIELQYTDIFSDLGAYFFARDFAKGRNYRLCLDGVTELMLPFVDRERLGIDLVKLVWNPQMAENVETGKFEEYRDAISQIGRARTILCRCDDEAALRFGHAVGIPMYQGRGIERMLPKSPPPLRVGSPARPGGAQLAARS
jgi:hypothetical protein